MNTINEKHKQEEARRLEADNLEKTKKKAESERLEKMHKDLLLPDKEKLVKFYNQLKINLDWTLIYPDLSLPESENIITELESEINQLLVRFENKIKFL